MPLSLFVFPINKAAVLPEVFKSFAVTPTNPLQIDPSDIEKNRDKWLDQWRDIAIR
jgi:thiamine transport system substrate-binding protein